MKVVLDANVLISALIKHGKSREFLLKIVEKNIKLVLSKGILEEFLEVTETSKVRKYVNEDEVIAFLKILGTIATTIKVRSVFKVVKEDQDDDIVLRTAHDGKAEYIVTGDKRLLGLREFKEVKIVTVNKMLDILKGK